MSGLELGGLAGGLAAGRLSDLLLRRQQGADRGGPGAVGLRVRVSRGGAQAAGG
jgi:hypothetical protein